ncbi:MAG: hypothetical protein LBR60_08895 [Fibrobacter sp.]|jgi:aldose 1-epimerase|nr:hypothetical protein [Fibrobacter sp.]
MFTLISRPLGSVDRLVIRHEETGAELEILSGWGAGLNAWRMPEKDSFIDLLSGYPDEETFRKTQADTSAGVILSPFPGRTDHAQWTWKGKTYKLDNNVSWAPHALHGFLHTRPWKMVSFTSDNTIAGLTLSCNWDGAHPGFPFPYAAETRFALLENSFMVFSEITNTGREEMPYAEGWHPYFSLGKPVDELELQFPIAKKSITDDEDIPTGKYEEENRFENGASLNGISLNESILLDDSCDGIVTTLSDPEEKRQLIITQNGGREDGFNALQLYTPPDRKSIAIEPMTGEPDMLNHHRGLIVIPPGEKRCFSWHVQYEKRD